MSKVVQAVNSMVSQAELISGVIQSERGEIYFVFGNKYVWSIDQAPADDFVLYFYPDQTEPKEAMMSDSVPGVPTVRYRSSEIGTREAKASFAELYTIVSSKLWNMEQVLNDIIGGVQRVG